MERKTSLAGAIDILRDKKLYDAVCKRLLSEKAILAYIMKEYLVEYKGLEFSEIALHYIEGDVKMQEEEVHRDEKIAPRIVGLAQEDTSVFEGTVTFDIYFSAITPSAFAYGRVYVDVEAQGVYEPGYPLEMRGVYYCSRVLSAQYGKGFSHSEYGNLKKVYSIWVCNNPPVDRRNTVTHYYLTKESLNGTLDENTHYDLLHILVICLGNPDKAEKGSALRLLDVLFSEKLSTKDKKDLMVNEFHIPMEERLERSVEDMCTFSDGLEERVLKRGERRGERRGRLLGCNGIVSAMRSLHASREQIVEQLMIQMDLSESEARELVGEN